MAFCFAVIKKKKNGKAIRDFDESDWREIAGDTGFATVRGGVRGASIYILSNYTATPAFVASSIVTASFGVAEQAHLYRNGEIDAASFIENSENLCLDVSISALSSLLGQTLIPVPILGAIVGNTVGTMMLQIARDNLNENEQQLIANYMREIHDLDEKLELEYQNYLKTIEKKITEYMMLLDKAFALNARDALLGSVKLASYVGVPDDEVLKNLREISEYYMN